MCQVDLLATFARLVGQKLDADVGPDSLDKWVALLGEGRIGRCVLIEQGGPLALRFVNEKLVTRPNAPRPAGRYELYDLHADPGEKKNLAAERPGRVRELAEILERQRTTPTRNP
jgi:hypothetical protein